MFNDVYQRGEGANVVTAMLFSGLTGIAGIIMLVLTNGDAFQYSLFSMLLAFLSAAKNVLSAYLSIMVLSRANLSVYSLYSMLGGMLLPFGYAILFCGEPLTWQKCVCTVLVMGALLLGLRGKDSAPEEKRQQGSPLPWYLGVFVMNGLSGVFSTIHQRAGEIAVSASAYSLMERVWGLLIVVVVLLVCRSRGQAIRLQKPLRSIGSTVGFGVITTLANLILLIALLHVDASIQYPIVTGGVIVLSLMWDWILGKKPNRYAVGAAAVSFAGLLFLTI
ncbi:MAG: hypothetical protein IJA83_08510 [Clostridia bacterium]|nr:hypothetical protein [Clostridia bacterium]